MATLIPSLGADRFDTRGELRLAERLRACLEDNTWATQLAFITYSRRSALVERLAG
jgi:hypothetical protein